MNELIAALRICSSQPCCDNCPRYDIDHAQETNDCCVHLLEDAADALEAAEKRIAELEAQMPKEGEWMPVGDGTIYVKCSVCGEEMCCRGHYCPNCGAKMDGERKDGERRTDETEGS